MALEFRLPNLGEGIEAGDVVRVTVTVGERIKLQQTVIELETDKALVEVPSSVEGIVEKIHVEAGDKLTVDGLILTVAGEQPKAAARQANDDETASKPQSAAPSARQPAPVEQPVFKPVVGGEDCRITSGERRNCGATKCPGGLTAFDPEQVVPAGPATRRFARELGVDLHQVIGSGRGGRVTKDDVRAHVKQALAGKPAVADATPIAEALPDFSQWGEVKKQPLSNVRRKTAEHLAKGWAQVPQVTQYESFDITGLEALRKRFKAEAAARGSKLTTTVFVIKALVAVLQEFPQFNASIDLTNSEMVYKRYYHIGIAVDTERGLLVPVLRDVDQKSLWQLGADLDELAATARTGKIDLAELRGGTFTISNQGGIGGAEFSPLVNHPEVGILGLGRARIEPQYIDGELMPRLMLPVGLSYDHRAVDGADAARFLLKLQILLEEPERLLLGL